MMESSVSFFINKLIQHWDCSNKINSHFFSDLSKIIPLIMYYIPRYQLYNTLILKDIFTRKTDWNRSVLHKHFLNGYQNRIKSNWKWRVISIYTTSNHLPFSQKEGGGGCVIPIAAANPFICTLWNSSNLQKQHLPVHSGNVL